jgi:6,7-dimethyl-8-ribityllumazine synthase
MPPIIEGRLEAAGLKFAVLASRWNDAVTNRLLSGATDALRTRGAEGDSVDVVRVPGAFELPQAALKLAAAGRYDGIVALGCLIRGETPHFDVLAAEAARGLSHAAMASGVPVAFGVLTCDTLEQAMERSGGAAGNKGWDAALAAIEMVSLYRRLA